MKKIVLLIVFLFLLIGAKAQFGLTFIQVDTATYRAYLNSNWDRIIEVGQQAFNQNIDYYYLRLRVGYAYFKKNQYRKAAPHYKKALEFSSNDAIASEYLYYCYQNSGRTNDAIRLKGQFNTSLKEHIDKGNSHKIHEIGLFFTFGTGVSNSNKTSTINNAPTSIDGSQILPNNLTNWNLDLSHELGSLILARHSFGLMSKDEYSLAVINATPYLSESQIVRQFNYHLAFDLTLFEGLTISPLFSYINYRIPVFYQYGVGSGNKRSVYRYDSHNEFAFGIKGIKQLGIFEVGVSVTHANFNLCKQTTVGTLVTAYPFGNLNNYYSAAFFAHQQSQNSNNKIQYVQSYKIGAKVFNHMWVEGSIMFGGFSNFYNSFTGLTYNSLEKYNSVFGANLIFPFYKPAISVFVGYRNHNSESMFVPVNDVFNTQNIYKMNYHSITGGISWKI